MQTCVINFSFLKTTIQDFEFIIYRKSRDDGYKPENTYEYNLPFSDKNLDIRDRYLVSFVKREGFIEFKCKSLYNIYLTKKWMMEMLIKRVEEILDEKSFWVGTHFIPNISFLVRSYKEGNQIITVEPYYLTE